jgi:CRISPR/Cas system-associated exonuclease Cas4 (RecB family)
VSSFGSTCDQTGIANEQRGWKWQPLGRSIALGMSPVSAGLIVLRCVVTRGAALTSACVYGCRGSAKISVMGRT